MRALISNGALFRDHHLHSSSRQTIGIKKWGLEINMYADQAGLLKRTRVVGTYAYHLPLNANDDQLHFGISLGALSERLNTEEINGTISDVSVQHFNERPIIVDGDFGMAYTSGRLNLQVAVPNLKNFLRKERYNAANWNIFLYGAELQVHDR
jgi:hypothetical protein